jgi:low affinity Fe/Cu permease
MVTTQTTRLPDVGSERGCSVSKWFAALAARISRITGSYWAFITALAICLTWALSGPIFGFSDTWQLVINTGTTILTFLMVFLIQNTQNRDSKALQLKLDELIHAVDTASDKMIDIEEDSDDELDQIADDYRRISNAVSVDPVRATRTS